MSDNRKPNRSSQDGDAGRGVSRISTDDILAKWAGGVIAPTIMLYLAIGCWVRRRATLPGRYGVRLAVEGASAVGVGFICLGLAVFLFSHFFLPRTRSMWRLADVGRASGLIVFLGALLYVIYRVAVS